MPWADSKLLSLTALAKISERSTVDLTRDGVFVSYTVCAFIAPTIGVGSHCIRYDVTAMVPPADGCSYILNPIKVSCYRQRLLQFGVNVVCLVAMLTWHSTSIRLAVEVSRIRLVFELPFSSASLYRLRRRKFSSSGTDATHSVAFASMALAVNFS